MNKQCRDVLNEPDNKCRCKFHDVWFELLFNKISKTTDPFESEARYSAHVLKFRDSFLDTLFEFKDGLDIETLFLWMTDVHFENQIKFLSSITPSIFYDEEN